MALPDPDALLTRRAGAAALTAAGYPTAPATLARKASVGGGPVFRHFGPRVLYRWGDLLDWAHSRMGAPVRTTSELDTERPTGPDCASASTGHSRISGPRGDARRLDARLPDPEKRGAV
jgi:hypothetical protein